MATKKRSHRGQKTYKAYRETKRYAINKEKKLTKHLKKFPNDTTAAKALKAGNFSYKRAAPKKKEWSSTDIHFAKLYKEFGRTYREKITNA
jgi:hypothetical protein